MQDEFKQERISDAEIITNNVLNDVECIQRRIEFNGATEALIALLHLAILKLQRHCDESLFEEEWEIYKCAVYHIMPLIHKYEAKRGD